MACVLVIEDDPGIQKVVSYNLQHEGYDVLTSSSGGDGLELARTRMPDIVVLDLMLPDVPGEQVCSSLKSERATARIPILILTARRDESDRIQGLELGADDYVVKPFSVRELILRIAGLLRRCQISVEAAPGETEALSIDREAHTVLVGGALVSLTVIEYKLLCALYDRRGRVGSREALLQEIWGWDREVTARAVDTHVQRLREKLGTAASCIQTVRGFGYRFSDRAAS